MYINIKIAQYNKLRILFTHLNNFYLDKYQSTNEGYNVTSWNLHIVINLKAYHYGSGYRALGIILPFMLSLKIYILSSEKSSSILNCLIRWGFSHNGNVYIRMSDQ